MKQESKQELRWCSKHQRVHAEHTYYDSCRFPNMKQESKPNDGGRGEELEKDLKKAWVDLWRNSDSDSQTLFDEYAKISRQTVCEEVLEKLEGKIQIAILQEGKDKDKADLMISIYDVRKILKEGA